MSKRKSIVTRTAAELARALGLAPHDAIEIEFRSQLNEELIRIATRSGRTHAQIAKAAGTSRSRVTAILNRNTHEVSTDLLLRILGALGYRATVKVSRIRKAA